MQKSPVVFMARASVCLRVRLSWAGILSKNTSYSRKIFSSGGWTVLRMCKA